MIRSSLITFKNIILSPLSIGVLFFLILQLPIFNYGFNYRDEGFLLNNAQRINNGEMPYLDFSLALTPGAFYIQALAMKLFGNYIITDRIMYILSVIIVLILSSKLFKFSKDLNYILFLFLPIAYAGLGSFASYNIYGVIFVLIALLLFNKLRESSNKSIYPFLIGLTIFSVFFAKQTYGAIFFFSLLILLIFFTKREYLFKNIIIYLAGCAIPLVIIFFWLYLNGILNKLINNVFYFALSVKSDRAPFILTSIIFIPFYIFLIRFVKKFTAKKILIGFICFIFFFLIYISIAPTRISYIAHFYKEPTIYYFLLLFTFPLTLLTFFFKSKNSHRRQIAILSIEAFSLFLASAFSGRDYTTVIVAWPLYIPLFLYVFTIKYKNIKFPSANLKIAILLFIFVFPSVISLIGAYGKLYGIGYKKDDYASLNIREAANIQIHTSQKNDLELVNNFIRSRTPSNNKLLCIPYCSFSNFLNERGNASYFGFFYKFKSKDQDGVINDLDKNSNSIILVQKNGPIEMEANYEDINLNLLKRYIVSNYKLIKSTQNFNIYEK